MLSKAKVMGMLLNVKFVLSNFILVKLEGYLPNLDKSIIWPKLFTGSLLVKVLLTAINKKVPTLIKISVLNVQ